MRAQLFNVILFSSLMTLWSCDRDNVAPEPSSDLKEYLHLSHTRTNANPDVVEELANLNFSDFDMLWLGGDLAQATSADEATMMHIDSIFDVQNPNTLWALGNHDYPNLTRIQTYTNRLPYFTYHLNGITFLILDTQDDFSNIAGAQQDFFNQVMDTLEVSSHLIVLHHKLIWMHDNPDLESQIAEVSNGGAGDCFYCLNPNNFYSAVYPRLVEAQEQGVKVICIGGDIGFHTNEFEYTTDDGIHFLASGISEGKDDNQCLLFQHDLEKDSLMWEFKRISDF